MSIMIFEMGTNPCVFGAAKFPNSIYRNIGGRGEGEGEGDGGGKRDKTLESGSKLKTD